MRPAFRERVVDLLFVAQGISILELVRGGSRVCLFSFLSVPQREKRKSRERKYQQQENDLVSRFRLAKPFPKMISHSRSPRLKRIAR